MKKLKFVFSILKRRIANMILLSIMFSSLLLIFMVGLSIKDIFYDYLRSDYGNIPDMKVKLNDLNDSELVLIKKDIKQLSSSIDILYGYENIYNLTITDSEDSLLANDMPVLVKGINLKKKLYVEIDGKEHYLNMGEFTYVEGLYVEVELGELEVKDKDSIKFISKDRAVDFNFCTKIDIKDKVLSVHSTYCQDEVDSLFLKMMDKKSTYIDIKVDDKNEKLKIKEIDKEYRTMVLGYPNDKQPSEIELKLENLNINKKYIEQFEVYDKQLFITFKRDENIELNYKRYISYILQNYINYNRFVLKVKNYSFEEDEEEDEDTQKVSEELVWLNELTDFLDMITFKNGNSAVASEFMASDLNNFGILDNFSIKTDSGEFLANIRSTFYYNPENHYDNNILIFNNEVMHNEFNIGDKNNYIDIYVSSSNVSKLQDIQSIVLKYDKGATFLYQEDIIPSIKPKKRMFNIVVYTFTIFIFSILFIAMYVVLIQFYSNFESELALLKLFGSNQPYQTYINSISFSISSLLIYFVLKKEELRINEIMQKYFFTSYDFDIYNYIISLVVLAFYIVLIYLVEFINIKKLNIIKGQ